MKKKMESAKKIIIALDVGTKDEALSLVKQLEEAQIFKVGLELFTGEGPPLLREIKRLGKNVFLDLKLHDIPNTVAGAVKMSIQHGAHMLTLHASGGAEMMAWASDAAKRQAVGQRPLLLAVTILTSLKEEELKDIGMEPSTKAQVLRLARLAKEAGMDGVVCSPQEIDIIREEFGHDLLIVTPGIRPSWSVSHDQKRITTPAEAIRKGANFLVIGRPITKAASPHEAFIRICDELNRAVDPSHGKNSS